MNVLIVSYDPFAMESRVTVMKEGYREQVGVCSDMYELASELTSLAYTNNIYEVKVHGPFAIIGEMKRAVNEFERNLYSVNKITIEGL